MRLLKINLPFISLLATLTFSGIPAGGAPTFVNDIRLAGSSVDLVLGSGANVNRLGMFSDLYYHQAGGVFYGLSDRGPGGGVISYGTRVQQFRLDVTPTSGEISNFSVTKTILFQGSGGQQFNGLNPALLSGNAANLGFSFDPEGFVVGPSGSFYVSDEYGPSVYEFTKEGVFVRAFDNPSNVLPRDASGPNFTDPVTTGRQDNRGYEGVTISPDGKKLYAILQDPLQQEGMPTGRRSPNVRIVEFDTTTGKSTGQYIYQLESLADINARVSDDFGANSQGRNIGVSSITALGGGKFLVIERDNRGLGVDAAIATAPGDVGSKRVYMIDIAGATNVSQVSLEGINDLPANVTAVSKSLYLDVQQALQSAGLPLTEKLEGLTVGPRLSDGSYLLLLGTDNDYSVTQTGSGTQLDVCVNSSGVGTQVPIDGGCPIGTELIPGYLYAFKAADLNYVSPAAIPEPATWGLFGGGLLALALVRRRFAIVNQG